MEKIYKKNEFEVNESVALAVLSLFGFILLIGVFRWLRIFNINVHIINGFIIVSLIPLLLPVVLVHILHVNKTWVKYVLITCVALEIGIAYVVFTFQMIILCAIPSIIATFYLNKKVICFTGLITGIVIAAAHIITGYHLFQPWIEPFLDLKSILLYGALPRIMQYLFCTLILYFICKRITVFFDGFLKVMQDEMQNSEHEHKSKQDLAHVLNSFTEREKEVFELLVQSCTNARIANQLCLSMGTVKNYVSTIYDKTEIRDRTALVLKYSPLYQNYDRSHT